MDAFYSGDSAEQRARARMGIGTTTGTRLQQVEARFAGHPTLRHVARTLVLSRRPGQALTEALSALDRAKDWIDLTPWQPHGGGRG